MKTMLCVCLGMLALSASASAQQQQECFEVAMTNATGGGGLGSILINKCTGSTWLLTRTQTPNNTTTVRWFPIAVEKSEATSTNPPSR
jgi:hypothetical protein